MTYIERYIALLEDENRELKRENKKLEESLRQTRALLGNAIEKWEEAVEKYHRDKMERC